MTFFNKLDLIRQRLRRLEEISLDRPDLVTDSGLSAKAWFNAVRRPDNVLAELDEEIEVVEAIIAADAMIEAENRQGDDDDETDGKTT